MIRRPPRFSLFPYPTLFRSPVLGLVPIVMGLAAAGANWGIVSLLRGPSRDNAAIRLAYLHNIGDILDRKSTRLNSSHGYISYAVFCLKKKKNSTSLTTL